MLNYIRLNWTGITTTLLLAIALPAKALQVQILPETPQLGDTISVVVTTDDPSDSPSVTVDQKDYPLFENNGKYRAFIPTSPLDSPGKMTLTVRGDDRTSNIGVWLKNRSR